MNVAVYKLLPRRLITKLMFFLARIKQPKIKNFIIRTYIKITGANTDFAAEKNPENYATLADFFTRKLADNARPIAGDFVSPVDGRCAVYSNQITHNSLIQAKGIYYPMSVLLGSSDWAKRFDNGKMTTLYLAPDDYHRIHMPCDGECVAMRFCPGDVHSVGIKLLDKIPNIFAGNERLVCLFKTEQYGMIAMILVGALNVSSIETVWHGVVKKQENNLYDYQNNPKRFKKGDEIALFNLGSTVIILSEKDKLTWQEALFDGRKILMGNTIAD